MRRDDRDQPPRKRCWGRRHLVAVLAVAGFGVVFAGTATQGGNLNASQAVSSGWAMSATHPTVSDATAAQANAHVGQFVTPHRPTTAATVASLLLPLLLLARRRLSMPGAVTPPPFRSGTPWRRGPPTFLAR